MGMNTLGKKLEEKKRTFQEALTSGSYTEEQKVVFTNAINSVDYIKLCYNGDVVLPKLGEDADSAWGMVYEWLGGSYKNIELAEDILEGRDKARADEVEATVEKAVQDAVKAAMEKARADKKAAVDAAVKAAMEKAEAEKKAAVDKAIKETEKRLASAPGSNDDELKKALERAEKAEKALKDIFDLVENI